MKSTKRPVKNTLFSTGFFIVAAFSLLGCDTQTVAIILDGQTMGTRYHITISSPGDEATRSGLQAEIDSVLTTVNQSFSSYIESSEVSELNRYKGLKAHVKSAAFLEQIMEAKRISELTDGAYDITIGPLVELWGFGPSFKADAVPTQEAVSREKSKVGYQKIQIDLESRQVTKGNPELTVDFSSIAKGYGVDQVADLIEAKGYGDYMVEIGGEMRLKGLNPEGIKWRIAVEKPVVNKRSIQRVINITNIGMATSGGYRNFFIKEGVQYSHTIDPRTGYPVQHNLASVTVMAEKSMTADAWATAFMVLGDKKGYDLAIQNEIAALFLVNDGSGVREVMTPLFKQAIERKTL
ncbi:MAG: lipoprotein ApbE [Cycloclasticus sp. symbiont of Poecilosclerida sp. M]|nr:MAG: lipoprotein ApbE [Cycloclasticus sp. symbiont of Poecilosclerida sp. M]